MKTHFSILQATVLIGLAITFINSCNNPRNEAKNSLNIEYKITGSNQLWIDNSDSIINKANHYFEDNVVAGNMILNNPSLVKSINWNDSTASHLVSNNKDSILYQSIIKTNLETDTLFLLEGKTEIKEYFVSGKTLTNVLTMSVESDSIKYVIYGIFNDTIQIKNKENDHAEKMAYFIIHQILYDKIHQSITQEVEKIASR